MVEKDITVYNEHKSPAIHENQPTITPGSRKYGNVNHLSPKPETFKRNNEPLETLIIYCHS
jgi:hypothetical protein